MYHYAHSMLANNLPHAAPHRPSKRRLGLWLLLVFAAAIATYYLLIYPWISRWGATAAEAQMALPGDELIADPLVVTTKAVTIHAPPSEVWPWLAQLGVDRGGMYSYLWVENWLLRLNVVNIEEIHSKWQTPQTGDFIRFTPKDYALNPGPGLHIIAIEPGQSLVGCFGLENLPPDCRQSSTWQFILQPVDAGATRLLLRSRTAGNDSWLAAAGTKLGYLMQFYMERKMLLTIQERAESQFTQR